MASFKSYFRWILNSVCWGTLLLLLAQIASLCMHHMTDDIITVSIYSNREQAGKAWHGHFGKNSEICTLITRCS